MVSTILLPDGTMMLMCFTINKLTTKIIHYSVENNPLNSRKRHILIPKLRHKFDTASITKKQVVWKIKK